MTIKPDETELTRPYWAAARRGTVLLQRCASCDHYWHPPQPTCPQCRADSYEWVESTRTGELYSFTIVHHVAHTAVAGAVPYVVALVRLSEGPVVICNLLGSLPPAIGMPVRIALGRTPGGLELPQAYPLTAAGRSDTRLELAE